MKLKNLVVSMAAVALSASAVASHKQQNSHKDSHELARALAGNSYEAFVHHNYLKGRTQGIWLGAYSQISGAHNTNYLLDHSTYVPQYIGADHITYTFSLDYADVLLGYDSNQAGFFLDSGYDNFAGYDKNDSNKIGLHGGMHIREAFLTYQFGSNLALKAGKFNPDFGQYNPYAPLQTLASAVYANRPVTGIEGVFASNNFYASVAGANQNGSAGVGGSTQNNAKANILIAHAGYDFNSQYGVLNVSGSYTNMDPLLLALDGQKVPAWLMGGQFSAQKYSIAAHATTLRNQDAKYKLWIYDANFNYMVNHKFSVGAYGNYYYNITEIAHWVLGATAGYKINHYLTFNAYAQRMQVTVDAKANGYADNVTVMGALSLNV